MTRDDALVLALRALREYDQLGVILNHQQILRELIIAVPDTDDVQERQEVSNMLMVRAIERAKQL